jgi:NADPH-dependent curcumin reductase CurA
MAMLKNRQILLASRPFGEPKEANFRLATSEISDQPEQGLVLKTLWLSLDPYMRGIMDEGVSYTPSVDIGGVMDGGTVSQVLSSRLEAFAPGDIAVGYTGWQEYAHSNGEGLRKLDPSAAPISTALGVLGMPGMTAYTGLLNIGQPKPGETLVVAAASGAVGSVVGQIAKLKGCHVIGVAGGPAKTRYLTEELGFDAGLDHHAPDFPQHLKQACPKGIDIYFENVGGRVWDAVFPLLNDFARIPVCGLIAHYNDTHLPQGPDRVPALTGAILVKRWRMQGFIVTDYAEQTADFLRDVGRWFRDGKLKYKEDVVVGLDQAPIAFIGLLKGRNFGKLLVKVAEARA